MSEADPWGGSTYQLPLIAILLEMGSVSPHKLIFQEKELLSCFLNVYYQFQHF